MKKLAILFAALFLTASASLAQEPRDYYSEAESQFYDGQYGAAIRTALEGLQEEPAVSSEASAVELCSILGASYSRLGDFDKAASYFVRCYEFDRQEGDPKGLSSSLVNLASMYVYAGKPELAEQYALAAVETEKPLGRPGKLAMAYGKACDVYHALGRNETALEYADLAVSSAREAGDDAGIAIRRSQRAYPLTALGRRQEATRDLKAAERVFRDQDRRQSLAIVCFQLARLMQQEGRKTEASQYYREAASLSRELQDLPLLQKVCSAYAEHLKSGNPSEAFRLLEEAASIQSEIDKSKSTNVLELYNIEYETARREQTIAAQQAELKAQKRLRIILTLAILVLLIAATVTTFLSIRTLRSERRLRQSNAQKDFLFKVISHDILSPTIAQLRGIQMLRKNGKNLEEGQFQDALLQLERQSEGEVELVENVLRWARSKDGSDPVEAVRFDLEAMAREAMEQYGAAAVQKGVSLVLDSPGETIVSCNRSSLLLALRNLLSNAIKFCREGGEVRIVIESSTEGILLSVSDNGIGIPREYLDGIFNSQSSFRRPGTAGEPSNGMGLVVSKDLVDAFGGRLSVESEEGKGTKFSILIPPEE